MKRAGDLLASGLNRRKPSISSLDDWCKELPLLRHVSPATAPAPCKEHVGWESLLADPSQWCDSRSKRHPSYSEFLHSTTRETLWHDRQHAWNEGKRRDGTNPSEGFGTVGMDEQTCRVLCKEGQISEAVAALYLLVQQGSYVSTSLFYHCLKWCTAQKDLVLGRCVHALVVKRGYESDAFLANHLICMYSSYGKLEEADQVFTMVALPDVYMWASIILAHARHGQPQRAINLYRQMRDSGVNPDSCIYVATFTACARAGDLMSGKEVHADYLRTAVELNDVFVGNCLVDMYSKCGSLVDACRVFDGLSTGDVVTWNSMIAAYAQDGLVHEALSLYASMQQSGNNVADNVTFVCLLKACATAGALHQGKQLHADIQELGLEGDVVVANSLIAMYARSRSLVDARKVFDQLQTRDVVTWNCMITGYAQHGLGEEALVLYGRMQEDSVSIPDNVTFVSLLKACASTRALHQGKELHAQIQERGLEGDVVVGGCLVDMYAKCGRLEDARRVFDNLPKRNVVTWTAMIAGYAEHGLSQEALGLYAIMQQEGILVGDSVTFVCLLKACTSMGALQQGKQLHKQIQEGGLEGDVILSSCLVDMYSKCGSMEEARRVFDGLPTKNVVTWTALLNGYAQHSYGKMAMQCFHEMQQQGVEPDGATFICLLVACSHEGLIPEGQHYFRSMVKDHGITPNAYHYSCMIDLLGRAGSLEEAEDLLTTVPVDMGSVGWICLLSACKSHGDVERGRRCFDRLVTMDPEDSTAYVLLGNIYADAGRWKDVSRLEHLRMLAGAWKKPGKACIEVKNKVHEFTVGDERADTSSKLKSMSVRLKDEGGHVPQTELVLRAISDSDKEDALCGHAEKLALAYGLLSTSDGTTLLVTKNLRMCNDCHSSTKIISRLEHREIVVRDAHRVHRFVNGSCSCGDRH